MNCPFCQTPVEATFFFCPTCGKKIREKPISTGIWPQLGLYALSLLLPPLNLPLTIRYLKAPGNAKTIGIISLILMCISLIAGIWVYKIFVTNLQTQVNETLKMYQGF